MANARKKPPADEIGAASPVGKSLPQKGIHVQSAMGWLLRRLFQDPEAPVPFSYEGAGPHHFGGGSENMKLLYAVVGFVGGAEDGRERILNWYRSEEGHGGGEPITVSHGQLHIGGHAAAALHAFREGDAEVLDFTLYWLQVEYALLSACVVNGEPWTPGARGVQKGKIVGENKSRGMFLRAVDRGEVPKVDQYFLGAWAASQLPPAERARIAKRPDDWPSIQGGLTIKRYADGRFWAAFDSLPIGGGGVRAGGFDGSEKWLDREGGQARIAAYSGSPVKVITLPEHKPGSTKRIHPPSGGKTLKIPTTFAELNEAANLPFHEAMGLISQADKTLVDSWGRSLYPNYGEGYLHSSDHSAALRILLEREPTFREVYDSYHGGSKNIDAARIKSGGGGRPSEWDTMNPESRLYAVLVHRYGITRGSRILDKKAKDPDPAATAALLREWTGEKEVPPPPPPPPPPVDPVEPTTALISGELRLKIGDAEKVFRVQEVKIPEKGA